MAWESMDTLTANPIPDGRAIEAIDDQNNQMHAEFEHRSDGSKVWIVCRLADGTGVVSARPLVYWQEPRPKPS